MVPNIQNCLSRVGGVAQGIGDLLARHTVAADRITWKSDLYAESGGLAPRILHYRTLRYAQCISAQSIYLR